MILVTGGAYQGKLNYAKVLCPGKEWADGCICTEQELLSCGGIFRFHSYIENRMKEGMTQEELLYLADTLYRENPEVVVVTDEIGYGIVPADAFEREYREVTGRVCTRLASYAAQVHRVICGVGTVIKG